MRPTDGVHGGGTRWFSILSNVYGGLLKYQIA
jgi:hypothetical protein